MILSEKMIIQGNWSFNIIQCVLTKLTRWDLPDGSAPFWRLYANISGEQKLFYGEQSVELNTDNVVIIPPETSYRGILNSKEAYHFFIHFTLSHPVYPMEPQLYSLNRTSGMRALLSPLASCLESCEEKTGDLSLGSMALICHCLWSMEHPVIARPPLDYRVERVRDILEKNLSEKWDMNTLARMVNLSAGGLSRLFSDNTGQSPLAYLNEKRINRACELLHDRGLSLENVAEQSGFTNRYYFTRVFKKYRRNTPAAFRKMIG